MLLRSYDGLIPALGLIHAIITRLTANRAIGKASLQRRDVGLPRSFGIRQRRREDDEIR